jgi:hypothetical protein
MNIITQLDKFHKTRLGYAVFGLVELALAYATASWAVDNGSLWLWILTLVLVVGALRNFVNAVAVRKK